MRFNLTYGLYKFLAKEFPKEKKDQSDSTTRSLAKLKYPFTRYGRDTDDLEVNVFDTDDIANDVLLKLMEVSNKHLDIRGARVTNKVLKQWESVLSNVTSVEVKSLNQLVEAVKAYVTSSPHHIFFHQAFDGNMLPYLCTGVKYTPSHKQSGVYYPAYTSVYFAYAYLGSEKENKTLTFHESDLSLSKKGGKNKIKDLLEGRTYFLETEELWNNYVIELIMYQDNRNCTGKQFFASGLATSRGRYKRWYGSTSMYTREETASKCVIDPVDDEDEVKQSKFSKFTTTTMIPFKKAFLENTDDFFIQATDEEVRAKEWDDDDDDEGITKINYTVEVPDHPYVAIFNLHKHDHYNIHINNLAEYVYDKELVNKLILPDDHKNLIDMLVQGTDDIQEDIVKGKTGGVIVVATGPPGTGKTLSAEVYSEFIEAPLYVVQCSQLGIKIDELETNLSKVLERAIRWKAILLIDEADVYVHERGNDIVQNAIVGVFLRILEYYSGVLFMTSNRDTIIDDAILSRALAHIRYELPGSRDLRSIWRVIADEFNVKISDVTIEDATTKYSKISGRDVKNILKLSNLLAKRKKKNKVDMATIDFVIKYQDISGV